MCEHVHLPLQSGSTRILRAMRRTYSRERFVALAHEAARRGARARADDRHHRRLPGRDRGRLRRDARGLRGGLRSTTRSRSSTRRGAGRTRRAWTSRSPRTSSASASSGSSRSSSAHAHARNQQLLGTLQEVLVEGPSRTDAEVMRGRTRTNKTVLLTRRRAGRARARADRGRDLADAARRARARPARRLSRWSSRIFGATASGKSALALALARAHGRARS